MMPMRLATSHHARHASTTPTSTTTAAFTGSTPTDYSTVDTNQTTFAIKNKGRVFRELEMRYGWPIDKDNIHMRFQNLRKNEVEMLYRKLKNGIIVEVCGVCSTYSVAVLAVRHSRTMLCCYAR